MHMSERREIKASPAEVYAALLDAEVLKACVPGAQELTGNPQDGFDAVVTQKIGPVKATFKGHVSLSDMVEGEKLTIAGEGKGGAAGFAKGSASLVLSPSAEGTQLNYEVDAKVGGKIAQLGSRLVNGAAKKIAGQFFENLQAHLEGANEPSEEGAQPVDEAAPEKKGWLKKITGRG